LFNGGNVTDGIQDAWQMYMSYKKK
jgi:hypothetical protein